MEKNQRVQMANGSIINTFCLFSVSRVLLQTHVKPDLGTGFDLLLLKGDLCMLCGAIKVVRSAL